MVQLGQLAELEQLGQLAELAQLLAEFLNAGLNIASDRLRGRTRLLVLQPTPFCNLDCSYCYLPNRTNRTRMTVETVVAAVRFVVESGLAAPTMTIAWHAGEPMVVPPEWYRRAFRAAKAAAGGDGVLTQAIQTNGVLIDRAWVDYLAEGEMHVGLSIDGPVEMHDAHRRRRDGRGTHAEVMRAVASLQAARVPFHAIAVVTRAALADPRRFCDFFEMLGMTELGLNFEETEGAHRASGLLSREAEPALVDFVEYVVDRAAGSGRLPLREMRRLLQTLRDPWFGDRTGNDENWPFAIVSVDALGRLSTFSPELLGQSDKISRGYFFGNVLSGTLGDVLRGDEFRRLAEAVAMGVERCRQRCKYFRLCGGGAPANKAAELGRLDGDETRHCQVTVKMLGEAVLGRLERDLAASRPVQVADRQALARR